MSLLIAIMSESYARLSHMKEPSTLQSLCLMMEDSEFLVHFDKTFIRDRYILWLGSEKIQKVKRNVLDKKIEELRYYVGAKVEQSDAMLQRKFKYLEEKQISGEAR